LILLVGSITASNGAIDSANQFIGFNEFSSFEKTTNGAGQTVLLSPEVKSKIKWDELVLSWNAILSPGSSLKLEARAIYTGKVTKYYTMAIWSDNARDNPRESVSDQKDKDGNVSTDTLILEKSCDRFQVRLTLRGNKNHQPLLKFLGVALTDAKAAPLNGSANSNAWGKLIDVPEKSQMAYPNGNALCSPTTVSMLMTYWATQLNRPELEKDVPEVERQVYDANWKGTGNWPFNTAYPGSFDGMRAYVTRLDDISELEDWIASGLPVGVSLCYNKLRGKNGPPSGHLVVCVGFTENGDIILNDPGTSRHVRKTFPRNQFVEAWMNSKRAVYLIYPEKAHTPADARGHWFTAPMDKDEK
jgi:hypothetical protein